MRDKETRIRANHDIDVERAANRKRLNALVLTYRAKAQLQMLPKHMHAELRAITDPAPLTDQEVASVVFYAYKLSLTLARTEY